MSTGATLLANVRLADGGNADLRMSEGVIDAIGPNLEAAGAEVFDGGGLLALPGMVDGHVHLDKTLTGLPWMPYPAGPSRASRIATERGLRAQLPPPAERASNLVRQAVAAGTTAFRSHADIGPDIGLRHVQALLEVKAAFAHAADFQNRRLPAVRGARRPRHLRADGRGAGDGRGRGRGNRPHRSGRRPRRSARPAVQAGREARRRPRPAHPRPGRTGGAGNRLPHRAHARRRSGGSRHRQPRLLSRCVPGRRLRSAGRRHGRGRDVAGHPRRGRVAAAAGEEAARARGRGVHRQRRRARHPGRPSATGICSSAPCCCRGARASAPTAT